VIQAGRTENFDGLREVAPCNQSAHRTFGYVAKEAGNFAKVNQMVFLWLYGWIHGVCGLVFLDETFRAPEKPGTVSFSPDDSRDSGSGCSQLGATF